MVVLTWKTGKIDSIQVSGFTAIELMFVLMAFAFIILSTNKIMNTISQAKEYNQIADQSNLYGNLSMKYIQDNYRHLVQLTSVGNDVILSKSDISNYIPDMFLAINKRHQTPCVYITYAGNSRLRAYLVFGNSSAQSTSLSTLEIATIAKAIGNYAGTLTYENGNYKFTGSIDYDLVIPEATISNISSVCQFIQPLAKNMLMLDLSKNSALFASLKGNIDQQFSSDSPDPSLKKSESSLTTMQTNMYLDNQQGGITAKHSYRAIDYGISPVNNKRIQIKSNAQPGPTSDNSVLGVNNAGVQAGSIEPISHQINAGIACDPSELGKISQEFTSITLNSQLQCMYNPTFCAGSGYCYLPLKSTTFTYQFSIPVQNYSCPSGTVVDGNQPPDNIKTTVGCPSIPGWSLTQNAHGEAANCYTSITKMTFCNSYQTLCTYMQGIQPVNALIKLRCTSSINTYTIDNYTQ